MHNIQTVGKEVKLTKIWVTESDHYRMSVSQNLWMS